MPIPPYQDIFVPLLNKAADGEIHTISELLDPLADHFQLTPEEREELLPSGKQATFHNRLAWAKTYLAKALVIESVGRGKFRITERGKALHARGLKQITSQVLREYEEFREFSGGGDAGEQGPTDTQVEKGVQTPEEVLAKAYQNMRAQLAGLLIQNVMSCSPAFFENLVLDLLLAMGYGGSRREAATAVGRSSDGGIDGIINEDRLGLDAVYIQAKRWQGGVGSPVVRDFVGSLVGHSANKGVLITTSHFTSEAKQFAAKVPQKVVLIDGPKLAELMIDFGVGVQVEETYVHKRIDEGYFDGE